MLFAAQLVSLVTFKLCYGPWQCLESGFCTYQTFQDSVEEIVDTVKVLHSITDHVVLYTDNRHSE